MSDAIINRFKGHLARVEAYLSHNTVNFPQKQAFQDNISYALAAACELEAEMAQINRELAAAKHREARLENELDRRNVAAREKEVEHVRQMLAEWTPVTAVSKSSYSTSTGSTSIFWFPFHCRL